MRLAAQGGAEGIGHIPQQYVGRIDEEGAHSPQLLDQFCSRRAAKNAQFAVPAAMERRRGLIFVSRVFLEHGMSIDSAKAERADGCPSSVLVAVHPGTSLGN